MLRVRETISCTEYPIHSCFTIMVVSTLALGSSLTTALHTICFARSAYLMNKQNSYHQCLNTLKTYIGIDLPLERSEAGSAMFLTGDNLGTWYNVKKPSHYPILFPTVVKFPNLQTCHITHWNVKLYTNTHGLWKHWLTSSNEEIRDKTEEEFFTCTCKMYSFVPQCAQGFFKIDVSWTYSSNHGCLWVASCWRDIMVALSYKSLTL